MPVSLRRATPRSDDRIREDICDELTRRPERHEASFPVIGPGAARLEPSAGVVLAGTWVVSGKGRVVVYSPTRASGWRSL